MTDSNATKAVMPAARQPATDSIEDNNASQETALREAVLRREAARQMGQAKSERKRAAVRENGKKGGRPPGSQTSTEARARMSAPQRERRAKEAPKAKTKSSQNHNFSI